MYKKNKAFTLIELMIALFVALVVFGGVFTVFQNQKLLFARQEVVLRMNKEARSVLFLMSSYIKNAGIHTPDCLSDCEGIKELTPNKLVITSDKDLSGMIEDSEEITFIKKDKVIYYCEGKNISSYNDSRCDFLIGSIKNFAFSLKCENNGTCDKDDAKGVNIKLELEKTVQTLNEKISIPQFDSTILILNRVF